MRSEPIPEILVVDNEDGCFVEIENALDRSHFHVHRADSIASALSALETKTFNMLISEIKLTDGSGFGLCKRVRENPTTSAMPIILFSRWDSEADRILSFESGADDFVRRPFFKRELESRVRVLARQNWSENTDTFKSSSGQDPHLSAGKFEVKIQSQSIELTGKEAAILKLLANARGAVRSREDLISQLWNDEKKPSNRCIDSHIKSLRRKIEPCSEAIQTVRGVGYRFVAERDLKIS